MNVSDLAAELGVPASAVLEQCQRFGIDAAWAGAELSGADLVVLRAELANADAPVDLTPLDESPAGASPVDAPPAAPPVAPAEATPGDPATPPTSTPAPAAVPPTAVSSMPEAAGTPAPTSEPAAGGFRMAGAATATADQAVPATTIPRKPAEERRATERRLDHSTRTSIFGLVVAIAALVAAEVVRNPWAIWGLWLLGGIGLLVALWNGNKGRRHVTTHPEKVKGLGLSVGAMVLAIGGILVLGTSVYASVGSAAAAEAPAGLGDRDSVAEARWGFQRLRRVADEGWKRPAKDAGTCWSESSRVERDPERIEFGTKQEPCDQAHSVEVIDVYAFNRVADAPYPGKLALEADAEERCGDEVKDLLAPKEGLPIDGLLAVEIPTKKGWEDADRDIACTVVTATRQASLLDS